MAGTRYFSYTPTNAQLKGAAELSSLYGNIDYDEASIKKKFDTATNDAYKVKQKEYQQAENAYYDQMANQQFSTVDAIRRANAQAIASGATKGMQAANELSAVLGLQQEAATGATTLATDRQKIIDEHVAALSQNAVDALSAANEAKLKLGTLGSDIYASDVQRLAALDAYWQGLEEAAAALEGDEITAAAQKYAADKSAAAQINAAKINANAQQAYSEALYQKDPVAWAMQVMGLDLDTAKAYIANKNKVDAITTAAPVRNSSNTNTSTNKGWLSNFLNFFTKDYAPATQTTTPQNNILHKNSVASNPF